MSDWSNETILFFLECYQAKSVIWNPKDRDHKDKKKIADAWSRLSRILNRPVKELKNKKEILMTTFRKHLKKKQESMRTGSGAKDIYKPIWFSFNLMEQFLLPVYICKNTLNTETQSSVISQPGSEEMGKENEEVATNSVLGDTNDLTLPSTSAAIPLSSTPNPRRRAPDLTERQMATAFGQLTNILSKSQHPQREDDECHLYAKLLAKKLRELPGNDRKMFMYRIDGLFINRIEQSSFRRETPSPQYSSPYRPPSASSVHIPNRASSVQTSYSEPLANRTLVSKRRPSAQTTHSEPLTANFNSKVRRTSTLNLSPPQYTGNDLIPLNPSCSIQPYVSNSYSSVHYNIPRPQSVNHVSSPQNNILHSQSAENYKSTAAVDIISEEIIMPPRQNILNAALLGAYEDFESSNDTN